MPKKPPQISIDKLNQWVRDAIYGHSAWREEAWEDQEFYDGKQWTDKDLSDAQSANITPLTVNRIFPVVNLMLGQQQLNPIDIVAKGRTQKDTELAGILTEGIKYVFDQNLAHYRINRAFKDQVIPGFGCLEVCLNTDPREEKIRIAFRDWKDMYWDPYGNPWFDPRETRYVFYQPWVNLEDLKALFPSKAQEIEDKFKSITRPLEGGTNDGLYEDEADTVELQIQSLVTGGGWADRTRKRCRPAEIWFTVWDDAWFARFKDGQVFEITEDLPPQRQYELIKMSEEVVRARIRRMAVATIFGKLLLQINWSPFAHSQFPYVPFVGYTDRWNFPYGVIRQIKDQNVEVNKRRSVALALLGAKKVIASADVASNPKRLNEIYNEATKIGGFVVVDPSSVGIPVTHRIHIEDQSTLAAPQIELMKLSEYEINEVSGENREALGYSGGAQSGRAIQLKVGQSNIATATIFTNYRRSMHILGTKVLSCIQQYWKEPKVLRITDKLTGSERFVALNQRGYDQNGRPITINNVTQGRYDIVVTQAPASDTVREKNLEMIIEWIKRAPPEVIPQLMLVGLELSDIPNKEALLLKIKPLLGLDPLQDDMSPQEIKQQIIQQLKAAQQKQAQVEQIQNAEIMSELERKQLENEKIKAEIYEILAKLDEKKLEKAMDLEELKIRRQEQIRRNKKLELESIQTGIELHKEHEKMMQQERKGGERLQ